METSHSVDLLRLVATRIVDLRAEFEAQLRAVGHVEDQLRKLDASNDDRARRSVETLRRDLTDMLANNLNIREVLTDLAKEVGAAQAT
jgi:hypothetical protein